MNKEERDALIVMVTLMYKTTIALGAEDRRNGVTVPPAEFCEDTEESKQLKELWLKGWNSTN